MLCEGILCYGVYYGNPGPDCDTYLKVILIFFYLTPECSSIYIPFSGRSSTNASTFSHVEI